MLRPRKTHNSGFDVAELRERLTDSDLNSRFMRYTYILYALQPHSSEQQGPYL